MRVDGEKMAVLYLLPRSERRTVRPNKLRGPRSARVHNRRIEVAPVRNGGRGGHDRRVMLRKVLRVAC